jgi:uncharacterized membrane protein (UPF0182 family)
VTMRPMPAMILSRRAKIALSVVGIIVVLLIVLVKLSGVYVNYLWFGEVGQRQVYGTMIWTKVTLFFIFGILMALIIGANLVIAYLLKPPFRPMSPEQQNLQNYVLMVEPRRKLILAGVMVVSLLGAGASAQGDWKIWQLWLNGGSFGIKDPQFHKDISFFAWDYPVYRALLSFGFTAVLFSLVLSIGIHYLTGAIRLQTPGPKITLSARRHLTALVFVFMALKAVAYWMDRYGFVFSSRSKFTGASYTDVHSALPAKTILFWIAIILALGVLASIWLRSLLLPGIGFVVLLILSILISGIYPAVVQRVSVKPNASDKEAPYILKNITATRQAYGIVTDTSSGGSTPGSGSTVSYSPYAVSSDPAKTEVTTNNTTVDNIRITDPNVVSPTFTNAQRIRQVYGFAPKLDVDRYTIDKVEHDYVVGVREAVPTNLIGSQNNWINQHTVYTHGYGLVAAEADEDITQTGAQYTQADIPQAGPLTVAKPQIYYGELMSDYSVVGAKDRKRESDATGDKLVTYTGKGGVPLNNPLAKLALALKYKETNFLLNDAVGAPGAKLIFNRDPKTRVQKVAPFLTVDGDPYPVADPKSGHIVWIVDAYTTMANYPYSERQSLSDLTHTSLRKDQKDTQINYIRNSVKATVDAYDGTVTLYRWDTSDPVLKAWMKVFPGLVKSSKDMPATIRDHVRYPEDLFDVQRALLAQYHVNDPVTFYNGRDRWAVPADPFEPTAGDQPPYYVLANSPNPDGTGSTTQFQLTTPMLVNNSPNLAAYISADSDPGADYGKITVLSVSDKSAVQGPGQVANVFRTQSQIASDIRLLGGGESSVIHGNLLTLPLGSSFLYVEPLYVQSTYPTLQRVLVTYGNNIGYGSTLANALSDFKPGHTVGQTLKSFGGSTTTTPGGSTGTPSSPPPTGSSSSSSPPPVSGSGTVSQLLAELSQAVTDRNAAYDSHDATRIAEAEAKVQNIADQLVAAQSKAPTPTSPTAKASPSK